MSHKTLLKRFRGEASSSSTHHGGLEQVGNKPIPIEIAEPDEPDPVPRSMERWLTDDIELLKKKYRMLLATLERRKRKYDWSHQCLNCVKRLDDVVRKVHSDLLDGRISMVGVTLTRKLPITTCDRGVQTSPDRMHKSPERMHTSPDRVQTRAERSQTRLERSQTRPERAQTKPERRQPSPKRSHKRPKLRETSPERVQIGLKRAHTSPERVHTNPKRRHTNPKRVKTSPRRVQTSPERMQADPERVQIGLKRAHTSPERVHTNTKRGHTNPKRAKTSPRRVQTSPERMQLDPEWMDYDMERENSLTRDFCGGTDPSILEGGCQCDKCLVDHNVDANARSSRTKSRYHLSRIHRSRAHSPCKDDALSDLHHHILAGDKKTPGSMYVDILDSLHAQGPCRVPCKLRADVVWMNDHIPKQAETQTDLTVDAGVRDQGSQTNLAKSVGIQKGKALARVIAARSSRFKTASIQIDLPEMPIMHRPVGRVLPTVIHPRF